MSDQPDTSAPESEADYNALFCAEVDGEQEAQLDYTYALGESYVVADCVTETHVWEGGLDKRSSLDSIQQALFFSALTGKEAGSRNKPARRTLKWFALDGPRGHTAFFCQNIAQEIIKGTPHTSGGMLKVCIASLSK